MGNNSTKSPEELIPLLKYQVTHLLAKIARLEAEVGTGKETPMDGRPLQCLRLEADGGTSCNVPGRFGEGYGSFQIDDGEVQRVKFGKGHSNNSAEIRIIVSGLQAISRQAEASQIQVLVRSDSKIALKWVTCRDTPKAKTSEGFREAIDLLRAEVAKFGRIKTQWRGREHSVKLFGH